VLIHCRCMLQVKKSQWKIRNAKKSARSQELVRSIEATLQTVCLAIALCYINFSGSELSCAILVSFLSTAPVASCSITPLLNFSMTNCRVHAVRFNWLLKRLTLKHLKPLHLQPAGIPMTSVLDGAECWCYKLILAGSTVETLLHYLCKFHKPLINWSWVIYWNLTIILDRTSSFSVFSLLICTLPADLHR